MSLGSHKKRRHNSGEVCPMIDIESIDDRLFSTNNVFCLKVLYSFYNVMLLILGSLAICLGVWSFFTFYKTTLILGSVIHQIICASLIFSGLFIVFFIFLIGCCGSFYDNFCCWGLYSTSLLFVFLVDFLVCIASIKYKFIISKDLIRYLQHFMHVRNNQGINSAFDFVQKKFKCCGITSYTDWFELDESNNQTEMFVSDSCCISETPHCGLRIHPSNIYYDGCAKPLDRTIQQQLTAICLGSFGLCCVELFGIILSCCLMKKIKESRMLSSVRY